MLQKRILVFCLLFSVFRLNAQDYVQTIVNTYLSASDYISKVDSLIYTSHNRNHADLYNVVNKTAHDKILVLDVSFDWELYCTTGVINFKYRENYLFDLYLFDNDRVKCFIDMDDNGIGWVSKSYLSFVKGYHKKVSKALRNIRRIKADYIVTWDYFGSYVYIKDMQAYVYLIDQKKSYLMSDFLERYNDKISEYYRYINEMKIFTE